MLALIQLLMTMEVTEYRLIVDSEYSKKIDFIKKELSEEGNSTDRRNLSEMARLTYEKGLIDEFASNLLDHIMKDIEKQGEKIKAEEKEVKKD